MPPGVQFACDVGTVRIGLARSDPLGTLAVPLPAVPAGPESTRQVAAVVEEWAGTGIVVGLPLRLAGDEGPAATAAREWARDLAERTTVPVRLVDERLSTVQAQRALRQAGRSSRSARAVIDSAAAVTVLQAVLDRQARTGELMGEPVGEPRHEERRQA